MQFEQLVAFGPGFSALASSLLAMLTFFTVCSSRRMAHEMYETRLAQFRPVLYTVLRRTGNGARLHLRNVGPGPAMDIDIACQGDFFDKTYHLPFFGPGEKIDLELVDRWESPGKIRVDVSYLDLFGNRVEVESWYRSEAEDVAQSYVYPFETRMRGGFHCGEKRRGG